MVYYVHCTEPVIIELQEIAGSWNNFSIGNSLLIYNGKNIPRIVYIKYTKLIERESTSSNKVHQKRERFLFRSNFELIDRFCEAISIKLDINANRKRWRQGQLLITEDHPPSVLQVCRCSLQVDILENSFQSAIRISLSATTFAQRPFAIDQWIDIENRHIIQQIYIAHKLINYFRTT